MELAKEVLSQTPGFAASGTRIVGKVQSGLVEQFERFGRIGHGERPGQNPAPFLAILLDVEDEVRLVFPEFDQVVSDPRTLRR